MNHIISNKIGDCWIKSIKHLLENGHNTIYDDKGNILEITPLSIEIIDPKETDEIIKQFGDSKMVEFMISNFENQKKIENWGYSYGQRIYDYKGINQLDYIISKLQKNKYAKSATINLLDNENDRIHKPCFVSIDFKVRNDVLYTYSFFRSQDIGKKMYADAICLKRLGDKVCDKLNLKSQVINLYICSAHIYEFDINKVTSIVKTIANNV